MKLHLPVYIFILFFGLTSNCENANQTSKSISNATSTPIPVNTSNVSSTPISTKTFAADLIWQGKSEDFDIEWSKENIIAKNAAGKEIFSVKKFGPQRLKTAYAENFNGAGKPNFQTFNLDYKIVSVSGSLLFLKESASHSPQDYQTEKYIAVDLANPSAKIALTKFYSEAEIIEAINQNSSVAEDYKRNDLTPPKNFREFFVAYDREPSEAAEHQIDKCYFPKNVFESFFFDRIENGKLIAELGVPFRDGMREEKIYPLELILPVNSNIENFLKNADTQISFAKEFASLPENAVTVVSFNAQDFAKLH